MNSKEMIGRSLPRREAPRFVSGSGCYVDDVHREGMLFARVVRAQVAHGVLKTLDVKSALATPGVRMVLTGGDIAADLRTIPQRTCPLPGMENFLQKPLAVERVRYVGEPVAVVVADDPYSAEDAAERLTISVEPLPAVVDAQVALRDEVLLHPEQGSNAATAYEVGFGDCESAFALAACVVQERFYVHRHSATPLECRGLVAEWDEGRQQMTVWGAAKVPFANRTILAGMLGLQSAQVQMIECDVGGSFGVRGDFYPEDFLVPYLSRRLQRPVKWIEDRRESLMALNHSRESYCDLALAFDSNGTILGMRGTWVADHGAYVRTNTGVMAGKGTQFLPGPYRVPATSFTVRSVCTNKTPSGTYRGPGRYESTFFRERLLDIAAVKLGMDAVELRRRNLIRTDEMPYDAGALVPAMGSTVYDSGDYPAVFGRALEAFNWSQRLARVGQCIDGRYIGVGLACFVESTGGGPGEHARLALRHDGVFDLAVGASSAGQGHETTLAQVLADCLDIPMDAVRVYHGSTTLLDAGFGAYHSRSAVMSGAATHEAARLMRAKLIAAGAQRLCRAEGELDWRQGAIVDVSDGRVLLTLHELAGAIAEHSDPADRGGFEVHAQFMSDRLTYTFGVQLAEVAVDPATAQVQVLDYFCIEDIGRAINPDIVHGQTLGAAVQGLGGTLLDEFVYDDSGQLVTGTLADYLLPTSTDFPVVRGETLEWSPSPSNPLGVKGAGEGGIIGTGAAVANAVSSALMSQGVSITALPISMRNLAAALRVAQYGRKGDAMKIQGDYSLQAPRDRVWQALMDPEVLKASIPGCQTIVGVAPNVYEIVVKSMVGPVGVRMTSTLQIEDIVDQVGYRLVIKGDAGPAGFAQGNVRVRLSDSGPGQTRLDYEAAGEIGGKLAQVGTRLVEGVVAKMTARFFENFQGQVQQGQGDHQTGVSAVATRPASPGIWPTREMIPWMIAAASLGAAVTAILMCVVRGPLG